MKKIFAILLAAAAWSYLVDINRPIRIVFDPATDGPIRTEERSRSASGGACGLTGLTCSSIGTGTITFTSPTLTYGGVSLSGSITPAGGGR